jgi:hypothetical protein
VHRHLGDVPVTFSNISVNQYLCIIIIRMFMYMYFIYSYIVHINFVICIIVSRDI